MYSKAITQTDQVHSAWTVKGRNAFNAAGQTATLGKKAYGFTWAAFACLFLATFIFCFAGKSRSSSATYDYSSGGGMFSRNRQSVRSTRSHKSHLSRGSFIDSERGAFGGRGVKDDYS